MNRTKDVRNKLAHSAIPPRQKVPLPKIPPPRRSYSAEVERVVDGDTLIAWLQYDLHVCSLRVRTRVRLARCNAAEMSTEEGPRALARLTGLLPVGTLVTATPLHVDQFGRVLAEVVLTVSGVNVSDVLLAAGVPVRRIDAGDLLC